MTHNTNHRDKPLLTNREREVFELLVQDKTTKEIGEQLFISEETVRNHISNVMKKLGVKGRAQAVFELVRWENSKFSKKTILRFIFSLGLK